MLFSKLYYTILITKFYFETLDEINAKRSSYRLTRFFEISVHGYNYQHHKYGNGKHPSSVDDVSLKRPGSIEDSAQKRHSMNELAELASKRPRINVSPKQNADHPASMLQVY